MTNVKVTVFHRCVPHGMICAVWHGMVAVQCLGNLHARTAQQVIKQHLDSVVLTIAMVAVGLEVVPGTPKTPNPKP